MPRRYAILDVFTDQPLSGNPLAVVLESEGLSDSQMAAIASEFNLSETVFVLPSNHPAHSARIRIFTPTTELPFAGHPTVGTAVLLTQERNGRDGGTHDAVVVLEEQIGQVRCGVRTDGTNAGRAIFDCPKVPVGGPPTRDKDAIAAALGISPSDIGFENHKPSIFDGGLPYTYVPVRNLEALALIEPNLSLWDRGFGDGYQSDCYAYCRETHQNGHHFAARMFAPASGIPEDPATGSAAAGFAGVIAHFDVPRAGGHQYLIEQGFEMGRPSIIELEIDIEDRKIDSMRIGGRAVIVAEGTLDI